MNSIGNNREKLSTTVTGADLDTLEELRDRLRNEHADLAAAAGGFTEHAQQLHAAAEALARVIKHLAGELAEATV